MAKGQVTKKLELSHYEQMEFEAALPTYQVYMGMKLHFKPGVNYSWHEYGAQASLKVSSLYKARGRMQIMKLHKRFDRLPQEHLIAHLAANFIYNPNMWLLDLLKKDAFDRATEFKGIIENFRYHFQKMVMESMFYYAEGKGVTFMSLIKPEGTNHTWLLKAIAAEKLPLWFIVGLNRITGFMSIYDKAYKDDFIWPTISDHLKNIQGFYVYDHESTGQWLITEIKKRGL